MKNVNLMVILCLFVQSSLFAQTTTFTVSECDSYAWQSMTLTQSGTYYDTIPNSVGGDSILTLNLTINSSPTVSIASDATNDEICEGENITFTATGTGSANSVNNALNFTVNNYVTMGNVLSKDRTDAFTMEAWIKTSQSGEGQIISKLLASAPYSGYEFKVDGGKLSFELYSGVSYNGIQVRTTSTYNNGAWRHVALTYDGSSSASGFKFYVDGTLVPSGALQNNLTATTISSAPLNIGTRSNGAWGDFIGSMDEVRMWNYARSASQISNNKDNELTGNETGLDAYYSFNQGVAGSSNTGITTLTDKTSNSYDGTLTNFSLTGSASNWITGPTSVTSSGGAGTYEFFVNGTSQGATSTTSTFSSSSLTDGALVNTVITNSNGCSAISANITVTVNPSVTASMISDATNNAICAGDTITITASGAGGTGGTGSSLDLLGSPVDNVTGSNTSLPQGNSPMSIETWFKDDGSTGWTSLVAWGTHGNRTRALLGINNYGQLWHTGNGGASDLTATGTNVRDGQWHHCAVTYTGTTMKLYLDGTQVASGNVSINVSGTNFFIGRYTAGSTPYTVKGSFDEVRIWNDVRTATEISTYKDVELVGTESGLVAYFNFNDGTPDGNNTGVTLTDLTGSSTGISLNNVSLNGTTSNFVSDVPFSQTGGGTYEFFVNGTTQGAASASNTLASSLLSTSDVVKVNATNGAGCSATDSITITINSPTSGSLTASACSSYDWLGTTFTQTGIYVDTIANTAGCDSVITLNLTINSSPTVTIASDATNDEICEGENITFTATGTGSANSVNNALNFTVNNYVNMGNVLSKDRTDAFTMEAWIKTSQSGEGQIISKLLASAPYSGYEFKVDGGKLSFELYSGVSYNGIQVRTTSTYNNGAWRHVALTYDGSSSASGFKFYVDGTLVPSGALQNNLTATTISSAPLNIGTRSNGAWGDFIGSMDEVRMWNYARSASQISNNKDNELTGNETGLDAYYNFNQGVAGSSNTGVTTLTDKTSNSYDGTLTNFSLTGSASNWITGPTSVTSSGGAGTYEFYVNGTSQGTASVVNTFSSSSLANGDIVTAGVTNGNGCSAADSITITVNSPTYGSVTASACDSYTWAQNGMTYTSTGMYNDTIQNAIGCDSVITLDLTINSLPTVSISSDATNNASCLGETVRFITNVAGSTSAVNNALDLALNNYVGMGNVLSKDRSNAFTIEAWIKTSFTGEGQIISKLNDSYPYTGYEFKMVGGKISFELYNIYSYNGIKVVSTGTYNNGAWTHVAMTYNGTSNASGVKLYVNGSIVASSVLQNNLSASTISSAPLCIGTRNNGSWGDFIGSIDEVRIWNYARSSTELGNSKDSELIGSETGLEAYYDFNQGIPGATNTGVTTLTDKTSNNNDGALTNFSLTGSTSNWVTGSTSVVGNNGTSEFFVNGTSQGAASGVNTFSSSSLADGDTVTVKVTNGNGCSTSDSITITVNTPTTATVTQSSCDSYTWSQNGMTYNSTGMYNDTILNAAGCDSVITLDLTINQSTASTVSQTSCDSYTWAQNGMTYTSTGMYNDTILNAAGCDSVITLDLTINQSTASTVSQTSCDSYTWSQNGMTYSATGMYNDTILNTAGCDSVITLDLIINQSTASTVAQTSCDSYTWSQNGMTYTSTGMYNDTILNAAGCDSVITLDLTINQSTASTVSQTSCDSYTWAQNGMTYTSTGMYNDTILNAAGCDSVITLSLTINSLPIATLTSNATNDEICAGENITFTAIDSSSVNGLNFAGTNDEIVVTGATQFNIGTSNDLLVEALINTSNTTSATTIFSKMTAGTNVVGSGYQIWLSGSGVLTLEWGVNGGGSLANRLIVSGNTIINDGLCHLIKVEVLRSDSMVNLYVDGVIDTTVIDAKVIGNADNTANVLIGAERSNNSIYNFIGDMYNVKVTVGSNVVGSYNFNQGIAGGSNQGITTLLDNTNNSNNGTLQGFGLTGNSSNWVSSSCNNQSTSGSFEFFVNGTSQGAASGVNTFSSPSLADGNTVTVQFTNGNGCSAVDSITVTVNSPTTATVSQTSCDSYTWSQNGMTYTSTGMYNDTILNAAGCDSVITLDLTINQSTASTVSQTSCDSYTWAQNGMTYTSTGMYNDTILNAAGCDSVITLDLIINQSTASTISQTSCDSYTWSQNGTTYTSTGMYNDTILNAAGCDSVITLDLTINQSTASTVSQTSCDSYTWSQNGMTYSATGMYNDTILNTAGCDSVITLDLIINQSTASTVAQTSCDSYTWSQNGMTYTSTGMYNDTILNAAGCDSVITLDLTINQSTASTVAQSSCDSYTWAQNGMTYTSTGMYNDTILNAAGCDSVITLDLTIDQNDASVTVIGDSIMANNSNADSYQWLRCDSTGGYTVIAGATNQGFAPSLTANYAVIVTQGACVDTSVCSNIIVIGIDKITENSVHLKIYPNPAKGQFVVEIDESAIGTPIRIIDFSGKLIREEVIQNTKSYYSEKLAVGVYFIHVGNEYQKLIITQ